ncbi:MAG: hypothetical protein R2710_22760 [Acidimicrobiales bacterium]
MRAGHGPGAHRCSPVEIHDELLDCVRELSSIVDIDQHASVVVPNEFGCGTNPRANCG